LNLFGFFPVVPQRVDLDEIIEYNNGIYGRAPGVPQRV
jgi:hypothetical protein